MLIYLPTGRRELRPSKVKKGLVKLDPEGPRGNQMELEGPSKAK